MKHKIVMFLKFGSYENIMDLYNNGTVYMNTIEYFRKYEDQELRGDEYEGASWVKNSLPGTFNIPGLERPINYQKIHIKEAFEEVLGNIYSLYCISSYGFPDPLEFKVDEKNTRFGTHFLMIKDNVYFIEQLRKQLKSGGYKFHEGFVEYYDKEKTTKKLTLFDKSSDFEYQKEFRFYVQNDKLEPIKINLGSLTAYSEIYEVKNIGELKLVKNQ